ncbi:MAG: cupin domain-containing protein [Proteobacteria bacterium]|nr:cupin domain-containing protein [Pseudomonadota bacterium]
MARCGFVPPRGGANYNWSNDHSFVKVSSQDTNGAFALIEDNLKAEFSLGLHEHREHAETFYILEGDVDFYIDGKWMTAGTGTTIHIPPRIPHALKMPAGRPGRMLMICQPAGLDQYLAALGAMRPEQLADDALQQRLAVQYDIHNLGGVPA